MFLWLGNKEVAGVNQLGSGIASFSFFGIQISGYRTLMSRYTSVKQSILGLCRPYYGMQEGTFPPGIEFISVVCGLALDLKKT